MITDAPSLGRMWQHNGINARSAAVAGRRTDLLNTVGLYARAGSSPASGIQAILQDHLSWVPPSRLALFPRGGMHRQTSGWSHASLSSHLTWTPWVMTSRRRLPGQFEGPVGSKTQVDSTASAVQAFRNLLIFTARGLRLGC